MKIKNLIFYTILATMLLFTIASASATNNLTEQLTNCYNLDNTSLIDYMGNFNGIDNGITNTTGIINQGIDTQATTFELSNLYNSDGFSMEIWYNASGGGAIFGRDDGANREYWVYLYNSGDCGGTSCLGLQAFDGSGNYRNYELVDNTTTDYNFHQIVITWNGTDIKLYWDNSQITNSPAGTATNPIGTLYQSNLNMMFGGTQQGFGMTSRIDEVKFYNKTLNTSEITELYNSGNGLTCTDLFPLPPSPPVLPNITSFTTTNDTIANGSSTLIEWTTTDATSLDLSSINVTGLTNYTVSPTTNTTYTLTATNENGSVNSNLTINVYYLCVPTYSCSYFGTCNISNILPCQNVTDGNSCGIPYNPSNYSDFDQACVYVAPPLFNNTEQDLAPATIDTFVKLIVGLGSVATLVAIIITIGVIYGGAGKIIKK